MESEFDAWSGERTEKTARSTVDVNGDVKAGFFLKFIEKVGDFLDGFVVASVRGAKDDKNS